VAKLHTLHSFTASSTINSGLSSGKNSFAPPTRRTPSEFPIVRSRYSGLSLENILSAVPHTILVGTPDSIPNKKGRLRGGLSHSIFLFSQFAADHTTDSR
jgi:hypothetical protein